MVLSAIGSVGGVLSGAGPGQVSGWLDGTPLPFVAGVVGRETIESYDGDAAAVTLYSHRVVLNGEDVTAELAGDLVLDENLDEPTVVEFPLAGARHSPLASRRTWTKVPVSVHLRQGSPGKVTETLAFTGYVNTCSQTGPDTYRVKCLDSGGSCRYSAPICYEVGPGAGMTRDAILRQLALAAGYSSAEIDIPTLPTYRKPFHTGNRGLLDLLTSFGEPDALHWRTDTSGVLRAFRIQLREAPLAPQHVWHVDAMLEHPTITPPEDVASRWIVRGTATFRGGSDSDSDGDSDAGIQTEVTVTEEYGLYDPRNPEERQLTDGTRVPMPTSDDTAFRLISRLVDARKTRGSVLLSQVTEEWGWYNPRAGQYTTGSPGVGNGPGPFGVYYQDVYIANGEFVTYISERFLKTLRRERIPEYDGDGTLIGERVRTYRYYRRPAAIRSTVSPDANVLNILVGGDGKSYMRLSGNNTIEAFGLASEQRIFYEYDQETGARTIETTDSYAWFSVGTTIDPSATSYYVRFEGEGQKDILATFQLFEREVKKSIIDSSGRLVGEQRFLSSHVSNPSAGGTYDWGGFTSELREQEFRLSEKTNVAYEVSRSGTYDEIRYEGDTRTSNTFQGLPPVPAYRASEWTTFQSEPIEAVLDDEVVESWFCFNRTVIQNEFVQSASEAAELLRRLRSRELSFQVKVRRHETLARIGETVLLIDPLLGLLHRAIIIGITTTRSKALSVSEYTLEIPLVPSRYF